jgi:transmembrane sensor
MEKDSFDRELQRMIVLTDMATERKGRKEQVWQNISQKRKRGYLGVFKIAAMFIVCVGLGFFLYITMIRKEDSTTDSMLAENIKVYKTLDDGTKVWLNKSSSIRINKNFGQQKRELFLKGEAYFDVFKNTKVPLIIHAGDINIQVKGTAFNVKAYKENGEVQVALVRGIVEVSNRLNSKQSVLMRPNDKLVFSKSGPNGKENGFLVVHVNPDLLLRETRWTIDTLIFSKEKLSVLALRLEKKYDLKIDIQSNVLKNKRFSGTFTNETILQTLEALKLSYPLKYKIEGKLVVIKD